ncbi:MAG: tol-pal system-associated acyl-CoA thioesterase [Nitrospirae bacterium]|nr:tol-pal system-associated acyl-CoA thioesterase [Nitrospirota bacterium]
MKKEIEKTFKIKIYYEDTDAGGVVYYANYLKYLERARTEFFSEKGVDVTQYHNNGYFFVVIHVDIDYKRPAMLGDIIEVTTELVEMKNVTITLNHQILRDDKVLVDSTVKVACIGRDGKPKRIPDEIRSVFEAF